MAEYIIDGKPEWDLWMADPRRYTEYADQKYVVARATELYQREYAIAFPHDEWPAGRPALTSPLYERLKEKGAQFGARGGWERATWFPKEGDTVEAEASYHHEHWFDRVGEECRHVRSKVGVLDLGGFAKYEVQGEGAADWLDSIIAGNLPKVSRLSLSYFCAPDGGVMCEMTITRLAENHFLLITAAAAKWHDMQWLQEHLPAEHAIEITDITKDWDTLVVAGPDARRLLQKLTNAGLDNQSFPWLSYQALQIGDVSVRALRVNYVGELGWELHVNPGNTLAVYDALMEAGAEFDVRDFGLYAMESMRLEKCYRAWKVELDSEYSPLRSGLDRFVNLDKDAFIGKQAIQAEVDAGLKDVFVPMIMEGGNTEALYGCPVRHGNDIVGYVTSGGYGHCLEKSIALGYVRTDLATAGTTVEIQVLGEWRSAEIGTEPLFDPTNERPRADA